MLDPFFRIWKRKNPQINQILQTPKLFAAMRAHKTIVEEIEERRKKHSYE